MNGTTFTHTYSWVSIDSVTTYEGLIVFHRSRMPSGIGTCWHLPCYERPWHLSWTYKVLSFPSFQSSKFFKFLSFEAVVMAFMLYPFFFPLTGLSSVCGLPHWVFLFACMKCTIIAAGLLSSVFRKACVFLCREVKGVCSCVCLYCCTHIWIFPYICVLLSFGTSGTGWVSLQPRMGGLYIAPI